MLLPEDLKLRSSERAKMREKLVYPFINTVAHVVISLTIVSVNQLIMLQEPKELQFSVLFPVCLGSFHFTTTFDIFQVR